jgi:transposase
VAGDKLFVDWAGDTVPIVDPMTGEVHEAHLFIAAFGASSYTYAEARWSETLRDWIGAHVNALDFFGGVPKATVPDNLKAGITKPSRYEPGINRTYQDLADHYGFVVLPARIRRPRDKAKVEAAVGIVSRFVLGKLRNRRFFSLAELNDAVRDCVTKINTKVMKQLKQSRNDLFASLDRPALKGLPSERYQYAEWKRCTVAPDYHVEVDGHYYSVPFGLLRETVDARFTDGTIEVFHKGTRGREPRALVHRAQAHDDSGAHAVEPSALRRMDAGTPGARGREDRPRDDRAVRGDHEGEASSRAGLPLMPGHPQPGEELWTGAHRGGRQARQRYPRHHLRLDQVDPAERARSRLRQTEHAGHVPDPARQHPWAWLLPLSNSRMIACPREARSGGTQRKAAGEKNRED